MKRLYYKRRIRIDLHRYFPDNNRFWSLGFGEDNEKLRDRIKKHLDEEFIEKKEFNELEKILKIAKRRFEKEYDSYYHAMTGENINDQKRRHLNETYEVLYFSRPGYCMYQ